MKTFLRILWLVSGIALILAGIYALFNPTQTILSMATLLGVVTLLSGIFSIAAYFTQMGQIAGAGWILADGVLDVLLGILLLFYPISAFVATIFLALLSLWIIAKGITAIFNSTLARQFDKFWYLLLIVGIALVVFGVLTLFKPVVAAVTLSLLIGIFLISGGIEIVTRWWMVQRFRSTLGL